MTDEEKQRKISEENKKLTDIQKQVNEYANHLPEFAKDWMSKRLESYAKKHDYNLPPERDIKNTRDWLHGLQDFDPKLANKIDRISWDAGQQHQQKWHDKLAKKAEKLSEFKGNPYDVTPMIKYEDGFQWVKLNTPEAKDFEGEAMGNCVGSGNYDNKTIFSLRDKDNFPHVTIEYDEENKSIEQMKCKGNSEVADVYVPVVENLLNELKPEHISDVDYLISKDGQYSIGIEKIKNACIECVKLDKVNIRNADYAISKDGELYMGFAQIYDGIKEDVKFKDVTLDLNDDYYALSKDGSLFIGLDNIKQASEEGVKFDEVNMNDVYENNDIKYAISTDGTLYVGEDAIKNIPEDVILKEVDISYSKNITEFNNKVLGGFYAFGSNLEKIGTNAEFGGDVDIYKCENITEFNNHVSGGLIALCSNLTTIGPDAKLDGKVDITDTPLSRRTGVDVTETPEETQMLLDACKEQNIIQEPEEEIYSMTM